MLFKDREKQKRRKEERNDNCVSLPTTVGHR